MRTTFITASVLALALAGTALAQAPSGGAGGPSSPSPSATPKTSSSSATSTAPAQTANGAWQASKLIGLSVYNTSNDKIGSIQELLTDKDGKIDQVAIGVGGFLGMGTHNVAVKFSELKWEEQPVPSKVSSAPGGATTGSGGGGIGGASNRGPTGGAISPTASATPAKKNYPDHAVLNKTADELKAMPAFDYTK